MEGDGQGELRPLAGPVVAVVPARDAGDVGRTVSSVLATGRVDRCVVVDDGSVDDTAERARAAGAEVLVLPHNLGKGGAVRAAIDHTPEAGTYLLLDADLGGTAGRAVGLLDPVLAGTADLAIAVFPPAAGRGGFGTVKRGTTRAIQRLCGYTPVEALSGQRAVRADVLRRLVLAPRFGLEASMTVDAIRAGCRVVEVPLALEHEHTGRSLAGFRHRGAQAVDIVRGLAARVGTVRSRRVGMLAVAAAVLLAAAVPAWGRGGGGSPVAASSSRSMVLVTVSNTSLADLDRGVMPNIARLLGSTGGALTPRIPTGSEDQAASYASLGAGGPVTMGARGGDEPVAVGAWPTPWLPPTAPEVAVVAQPDGSARVVSRRVPQRRTNAYGTAGALGDALHEAGLSTTYLGARTDGPTDLATGRRAVPATGALALADADGRIDRAVPGELAPAPGPFAALGAARVSAEVGAAAATPGVVLVDAGGSQEPWPADRAMTAADRAARHERRLDQVRVADDLVGRIVTDHPDLLVVVVGVAPASHWRLTPIAVAGERAGAIWSPSTQRAGLSVLTDVAPTVLGALGVEVPTTMVGRPLAVSSEPSDLAAVQELHERTVLREGLSGSITVAFIVVQAIVYAAALVALSGARRRRRDGTGPAKGSWPGRLLSVTERLALACAGLPAVTFLYRLAPVPLQQPAVAATGIALGATAVAAVAVRFRRHPLSPLVAVAAVTLVIMVVDAASGGVLQDLSLFGYTPLTAARYYGMGNLGFAVLGAAVIVVAGSWVASQQVRGDGVFAAACLFAVVTVLQVAPVMGADFGGALVLVPTAVLAATAWSGVRIGVRRVLLAGAATLGVVLVLGALDATVGSGSHVGRFVSSGPAAMAEVVHRKIDSNVRVLTTSTWTWAVVVVGVFALGAALLAGRRAGRFERSPAWRTTLAVLVGFGVAGGLANDSGVAIPAMVAVFVGAFLLVVSARRPFEAPRVLEPA
ncbi:glycosyltransferase [Dermatobacter hominis]|uniref:glycosyltransferase n=1 Tax=Dermatobacter hominis TaxID=2884263 RepID=UPI001D111DA8|nr:glycosyltransferase [Dermatobacter hominis]UDY35254.1 glycosyltransferase [Dermatobacter hominis]